MTGETLQRVWDFLRGRSASYRRVFAKDNMDARVVLADLARFCRADRSTFHADHAISDRLDGRREVFLRIQQHLNLTTQELWRLYGAKSDQSKGEGL